MNDALNKKLKKVKLLVMDVDGVLTTGDIVYDHGGKEIKYFNVHDGLGIVLFRKAGYQTAIISGRHSDVVQARAEHLGVDCIYQNASPKVGVYQELIEQLKLKDEEVCFVGDDLPDLAILKKVGVAVAVANGVREVKEIADYTTRTPGGHGAVREVVEMILKSKGEWSDVLESLGS